MTDLNAVAFDNLICILARNNLISSIRSGSTAVLSTTDDTIGSVNPLALWAYNLPGTSPAFKLDPFRSSAALF